LGEIASGDGTSRSPGLSTTSVVGIPPVCVHPAGVIIDTGSTFKG